MREEAPLKVPKARAWRSSKRSVRPFRLWPVAPVLRPQSVAEASWLHPAVPFSSSRSAEVWPVPGRACFQQHPSGWSLPLAGSPASGSGWLRKPWVPAGHRCLYASPMSSPYPVHSPLQRPWAQRGGGCDQSVCRGFCQRGLPAEALPPLSRYGPRFQPQRAFGIPNKRLCTVLERCRYF